MLFSRHRNPLPVLLITLAPLVVFPSACLQGAQLENEPELQQALGCDMDALFKKCDGSGCHEGGNGFPPSGGTDFFGPGTPASLVGAPAVYPEAVANYYQYGYCPEERELIIDPINPDNSLFLKKLNDTQTCGLLMPDSGKLPDADIACFRQWVIDTIALSSASGGATGSGGAAGTGGATTGSGGAAGTGGATTGSGGAATASGGAASTGGTASAAGGDQAQL